MAHQCSLELILLFVAICYEQCLDLEQLEFWS